MNALSWTDVDLSEFTFDLSGDRTRIELSSNYDGSDVATITCTGHLAIRVNSSLPPNSSSLPVFVGECSVKPLSEVALKESLSRQGYGFQFEGKRNLPEESGNGYHIRIEGGEVEADIIAMECNIATTE